MVGFLADIKSTKKIINFIRAQELEIQANILSAKNCIFHLASHGAAPEAIKMIENQPKQKQASILASPMAIAGFASNDQGDFVIQILSGFSEEEVTTCLYVEGSPSPVTFLAYRAGKAAEVFQIISKLSPGAQRLILSAPDCVSALSECGQRYSSIVRSSRYSMRATTAGTTPSSKSKSAFIRRCSSAGFFVAFRALRK